MIEETYPESFGKSRGVGDKEFIAHVKQNYDIINKGGFNDNTKQTL
ncbi:MAG: hypothetical protein ACYC49_10435 [Ignavibacteriaceae bacterium]